MLAIALWNGHGPAHSHRLNSFSVGRDPRKSARSHLANRTEIDGIGETDAGNRSTAIFDSS